MTLLNTRYLFLLMLTLVSFAPAASIGQPKDAAPAVSEDRIVSNNYLVGVGDTIVIEVFGEAELSTEIRVDETGTFIYPYLGKLEVLGKSLGEIQSMIVTGLKGDYLIDPKVNVTIDSYREVYISGEVVRGGSFSYQPGLSISKVVVLAGGFTERAARNRIKVVSEGTDSSKGKRVSMDYVLQPGDIVTVPRRFF